MRHDLHTLRVFSDGNNLFYRRFPVGSIDVIYVDETGFNLHIRRNYGRGPKGQRVTITVPNSRGRNVSVCAAMNMNGLLMYEGRVGAFNSERFVSFLDSLLQGFGGEKKFLVMDNVRFHHTIAVREKIESHNSEIIFLPPYSPQLNPIELLFSKWKQIIKTGVRLFNTTELIEKINSASAEITVNDCQGWVRHSSRYLSTALTRQNFE